MKVCIGYRVVDGPWGGGNSFFSGLVRYLSSVGHEVVNTLDDQDIDIIVLSDPRFGRQNRSVPFSYKQAWRYARKVNTSCVIVHRINECDERKNTTGMNAKLKKCNRFADFTVFVGSWLQSLDIWGGPENMPMKVILNGSDTEIFNPDGFRPWSGKGPLKLVTHHWGGNWMKGFDVYDQLDKMLRSPRWSNKIEFTYIGNLPKAYRFENARHVSPIAGSELASALKNNHAYVTGSINEPGGNHQNEAVQCGLPIMYLESGCMPEYLSGFGLGYKSAEDFESKLEEFISEYDYWKDRALHYPNSLDRTCAEWVKLFEELFDRREELSRIRQGGEEKKFRRLMEYLRV